MSSSPSPSKLLSFSMLNFNNNEAKLESPQSKKVLFNTVKRDHFLLEQSQHQKDLETKLSSHNNQPKIHKRNDSNSKDSNHHHHHSMINSNSGLSLNNDEYNKFALMKLHSINEIKAIIDYEVYKAEFELKNDKRTKSQHKRDEDDYQKFRLDQYEKELKLKYSNNYSKRKLSELLSIDDMKEFYNEEEEEDLTTSKLATLEAKRRRLNDLKQKLKHGHNEKERELKEENRRLIIERRNKELSDRAKENEKKMIKTQHQAQSRSLEDLTKKLQDIETKMKTIDHNQKCLSINLKKSMGTSKEKKKQNLIKMIQNAVKQSETQQKRHEEYNTKHVLCNKRLISRREQMKMDLSLQSRINDLRIAKIKETINNNYSSLQLRNSQLLERMTQLEERALKSKERKAKEIIDQSHSQSMRNKGSRVKINQRNKLIAYENNEKMMQYHQKVNKYETSKEEKTMQLQRKKSMEENIRSRREAMLQKVYCIAHAGSFTNKNDYYRKVFSKVEYENYVSRNSINYASFSEK